MTGSDQVLFDGVEPPLGPVFGSLSITTKQVVNSSVSEAGTTIRDVVRSGMHVVAMTFTMTSPDMSVLLGMVGKDRVDLTLWLPDLARTETITCYPSTDFKAKLLIGWGTIHSDDALWTVDLEFTEF